MVPETGRETAEAVESETLGMYTFTYCGQDRLNFPLMETPEETDKGPETVIVSVMEAVPVTVEPEDPEAVPEIVPETGSEALPELETVPLTSQMPVSFVPVGNVAVPVTVPVVLIVPVPLTASFVSSSVTVVGMVTEPVVVERLPADHAETLLMVAVVPFDEWSDVPVTADGMAIDPESAADRLDRLTPDLSARHFFVVQVSVQPVKLNVDGSTISTSSNSEERSRETEFPESETFVVDEWESVPVTVPVAAGIDKFTAVVDRDGAVRLAPVTTVLAVPPESVTAFPVCVIVPDSVAAPVTTAAPVTSKVGSVLVISHVP